MLAESLTSKASSAFGVTQVQLALKKVELDLITEMMTLPLLLQNYS
ncbi:MAG: hypothetical protein IJT36_00730 [Alphaproteobacteria bacterium]|nr:hypothetical protein [Alphaproteobacteria bacterium]